jgi:hypothetical protein
LLAELAERLPEPDDALLPEEKLGPCELLPKLELPLETDIEEPLELDIPELELDEPPLLPKLDELLLAPDKLDELLEPEERLEPPEPEELLGLDELLPEPDGLTSTSGPIDSGLSHGLITPSDSFNLILFAIITSVHLDFCNEMVFSPRELSKFLC